MLTNERIDRMVGRTNWLLLTFANGTQGIVLDPVAARNFARAIEAEVLQSQELVGGITPFNPLNAASNVLPCRAQNAECATQDGLSLTDATQRIAELETEAAENCRIIGMSGEREARHLARIAELERECNGLAARIGKELNVENEALKVSVSEQAALIEKCRGALDYTACGFTSVKAKNTSVSMAQEALSAITAQKGGTA